MTACTLTGFKTLSVDQLQLSRADKSPITESQLRKLIDGHSGNHILKQSPDADVDGFIEAALGVYQPASLAKALQQKFFIPVESGYSDEG